MKAKLNYEKQLQESNAGEILSLPWFTQSILIYLPLYLSPRLSLCLSLSFSLSLSLCLSLSFSLSVSLSLSLYISTINLIFYLYIHFHLSLSLYLTLPFLSHPLRLQFLSIYLLIYLSYQDIRSSLSLLTYLLIFRLIMMLLSS